MTPLWLPLAGLVVVALAIYGAGAICSRLTARWFPPETGYEASTFEERWILGFTAWLVWLLALAGAGLLRPAVVVGSVAAVLLAAVAVSLPAARAKVPARGVWTPSGRGARAVLGGLLFGAPLAFVFAITVNPTVSWDGAVYHLTLPRLYLEAAGLPTVPMLVYSQWPQAVELLYTLGLALHGYVLAKAMHFGFALLVAVLLVRHLSYPGPDRERSRADRFGPAAGLLAAALYLIHDVVLFEMRVAYVDLAAACFALLAFLLLERALDAPSFDAGRRDLVLAGLACGLLASTKITGIVSAGCLALLLLPRWLRAGRRQRLHMVLTFGLPLAALWLPWLVRSWLHTGNPVYPMFWDLFGGPDWSAALGNRLVAWQRSIGMGREPIDYLLLPWRVLTAGGQGYGTFDGRLSPLWLPLLPLALWRCASSPRARRALAAAVLLFATWALGSQQMRFLIPALPLVALAIADGAGEALRRLARLAQTSERPVFLRRVSRRCLAELAAWTVIAAWLTAFAVTQPLLLRAGWTHFGLYADPRFEMSEQPPRPPVFDAIARLPEDATVLLLNSNHLFHCRRPCLADSFFEASQISDWLASAGSPEEVARRLSQRGISHVAWTGTPLGVAYPEPLLRLLERPDLARPVFARGSDRLWSVGEQPQESSPSESSRG